MRSNSEFGAAEKTFLAAINDSTLANWLRTTTAKIKEPKKSLVKIPRKPGFVNWVKWVFGDDFGAVAKRPAIPKIVPIPKGYRRSTPKEVTKKALAFANLALKNVLPIGKVQSTLVDGKLLAAQSEWHWDNHPNGGKGPEFWHPGISLLTPLTPVKPVTTISPFPVAQSGLPTSSNPFVGDEFGEGYV
jgi:hypothetical protein